MDEGRLAGGRSSNPSPVRKSLDEVVVGGVDERDVGVVVGVVKFRGSSPGFASTDLIVVVVVPVVADVDIFVGVVVAVVLVPNPRPFVSTLSQRLELQGPAGLEDFLVVVVAVAVAVVIDEDEVVVPLSLLVQPKLPSPRLPGVIQVEGLLGAAPGLVLELVTALRDGRVGPSGHTPRQSQVSL